MTADIICSLVRQVVGPYGLMSQFIHLVKLFLQTAYPSLQGAEKQVHYYRQQTGHPLFDSDTGYNIDLDIALAHLWSSDIFPTSAGVDGASAERRADRKRAKYNKQQLPGGSIVRTIPLVMEHFRAWGLMDGNS